MEKEQVIEKLEEVFEHACQQYIKTEDVRLSEIRELGETIIRLKQNVMHEVKQAEQFIKQKIEMNAALHEKDIARIAEGLKRFGVAFTQ